MRRPCELGPEARLVDPERARRPPCAREVAEVSQHHAQVVDLCGDLGMSGPSSPRRSSARRRPPWRRARSPWACSTAQVVDVRALSGAPAEAASASSNARRSRPWPARTRRAFRNVRAGFRFSSHLTSSRGPAPSASAWPVQRAHQRAGHPTPPRSAGSSRSREGRAHQRHGGLDPAARLPPARGRRAPRPGRGGGAQRLRPRPRQRAAAERAEQPVEASGSATASPRSGGRAESARLSRRRGIRLGREEGAQVEQVDRARLAARSGSTAMVQVVPTVAG